MPKAAAKNSASVKQESQPAAPILPMSYAVRINSLKMNGNTKGTASVTLNGQFAVRGISVMDGPNGLFVSLPSRKINDEYHDICFPCTKESRAEFDKAVLGAYEQARAGDSGQTPENTAPLPVQYDVRIHSLRPGDGTLKGTASVSMNGQFALRSVSIMEGTKGLFVSVPAFKGGNGLYKDYFFPCTKESRSEFDKAVMGAYEQALTQSQASGQSQKQEALDPFFVGQAPNNAPEMRM